MSGRRLVALVLCTWLGHSVLVGQELPNLRPFQAFNWPDTLVVHTNAGQPEDTQLVREDQDVFVDWAVINDGSGPATNRFDIALLVDGVPRRTWFSSELLPQLWSWVSDGNIGKLTPGFHTIRLEVDFTGAVEEADETDNFVEQQIAVTSTNIIPIRVFNPRSTPEGSFTFSVLGSIGQSYQVEYASGVTGWLPLEVVTNQTGIILCVDPIVPGQRSYRIRWLTP